MTFNVSNLYLILFHGVKGIGIRKLQEIYKKFGDFQKAYNAPLNEFDDIIREKKILSNIGEFLNDRNNVIKNIKRIDKVLSDKNINYISYFDDSYPKSLRKIREPPIGLYIKGESPFNKLEKSISIVGTRDPSFYGHSRARSIARELAKDGYIIVSGLARGIDMEAHLGALEGGGKTIAILGSGIENIYPLEHKNLAYDIIKSGGAIVSELYIDQRTNPLNLVNRNRIISGLSRASLIIEGDLNSGTRHEVNFAKMQNKFIFALKPSDLNLKVSKLPLSLIEEGAIEIDTSSDIINYLNFKNNKIRPNKIIKENLIDYIKSK